MNRINDRARTGLGLSLLLPFLSLFVSGCSYVYSPFITPPSRPLVKDQEEAALSGSFLPNVQPGGGGIPTGAEGLVRYAFSDRLTLQARAWSRQGSIRNLNLDGFSVEGMVMLNDSTAPVRLAAVPRVEFMMNGRSIDGRAALLSAMAWTPKLWIFRPYVGLGGGIGAVTTSSNGDSRGANDGWGYGFIGNAGANVDLGCSLGAGGELAGIFEVSYDGSGFGGSHLLLVPSVNVAWRF